MRVAVQEEVSKKGGECGWRRRWRHDDRSEGGRKGGRGSLWVRNFEYRYCNSVVIQKLVTSCRDSMLSIFRRFSCVWDLWVSNSQFKSLGVLAAGLPPNFSFKFGDNCSAAPSSFSLRVWRSSIGGIHGCWLLLLLLAAIMLPRQLHRQLKRPVSSS